MSHKFTEMWKEVILDLLSLVPLHLPVSSGNNHEEIFVLLVCVQPEIRKTDHLKIP